MVDRFPVVLRGYDKEKVDAAFDATQESMKRAQQTLASMREQIAADDDRILQLQAQLQEEKNKKPEGNSFASLGATPSRCLPPPNRRVPNCWNAPSRTRPPSRTTLRLRPKH